MSDTKIDSQLDRLRDMFAPEELHPDLSCHLVNGKSFQHLSHPLVCVPYFEMQNKQINMQYAYKTKAVADAERDGNYRRYIYLHERPYRFDALREVMYDIGDDDYWSIVSSVWIDSENIWQNISGWRKLWESDHENREKAMSEEDRKYLASLPEIISVYRGVNHSDAVNGLSWTLDRSRAKWFAERFTADGSKPIVVSGTVKKSDVLAFFSSRNEQEIVVFPENVNKI